MSSLMSLYSLYLRLNFLPEEQKKEECSTMIYQYCFPEGKPQALTFSYDDGTLFDRRLTGIFNEYGMKCTFNLNSGLHQEKNRVPLSEYRELYKGHEIACHGLTHNNYPRIPPVTTIAEIQQDRLNLEAVTGRPVRGLAYPCGRYDDESIQLLRSLGIVYSRTVKNTNQFNLPEDFMKWHPTVHHKGDLEGLGRRLLQETYGMNLMYVWGHSYEFDLDNNWEVIENFCRQMQHKETVWYATNIEIYDYVQACKRLIFSMDGHLIENPSALCVWLCYGGKPVEIPSGAVVEVQ